MTETWKPCPGYEGLYSVSNLGRVRRDLTTSRARAGHSMKLTKSRGYVHVCLSKNSKERNYRVHRLVYAAFNNGIPDGLVINHVNGDTNDNRLTNLAAVTVGENVRHAFRELGRRRPGEKLTAAKVAKMREARAKGATLAALAKRFGVTPACVSGVVHGKTWRHAKGPIEPPREVKQTWADVGRRISDKMVEETVARHAAGERAAVLAAELGVNKRTIYNWIAGRSRQH